jgi:hypothetical protein
MTQQSNKLIFSFQGDLSNIVISMICASNENCVVDKHAGVEASFPY